MSKYNEEAVGYEEAPVTTEDIQNEVAINEKELLKALTGKGYAQETMTIEVNFRGIPVRFRIRALSEREYDDCRERCTKYSRNRRLGNMRMPEKTDTVKYHTLLIYTATVDEDKEKLWDNKTLWDAVNAVTGTDMVDKIIPLAGKKQAIIDKIEELSGFNDEDTFDETVKN